jgi:hypothetical protein
VRAYARRAEEAGFTHVLAHDHVVGADPAVHTRWDGPTMCTPHFIKRFGEYCAEQWFGVWSSATPSD